MSIIKSYKSIVILLVIPFFLYFVFLKANGCHHFSTIYNDDDYECTDCKYQIPKIIHQLWNDKFVPRPVVPYIKTWLNKHPKWNYWFWTRESQERFLIEKYPAYSSIYENYRLDIEKSDMIRFLILYEFGGVYADLDIEVVKPLDDIIKGKPCLMVASSKEVATIFLETNETYITNNALIACRPGHPLLKLVLNSFHKGKNSTTGQDVMKSTGPLFLDSVVKNYIQAMSKHTRNSVHEIKPSDVLHFITSKSLNDVYIAQSEYFLPNFAPIHSSIMKLKCRNRLLKPRKPLSPMDQKKLAFCLSLEEMKYQRNETSRSYTVHHWMGSWVPNTGWVDVHKNNENATNTDHVNIETIFEPYCHSSGILTRFPLRKEYD